jgi:tRNA(Ile)-lysidine synthase
MEYLSVNQVPYVTDHTNEEELYTRNILRLKVLPIFEKINPSVKNSIINTANNLKEAEKIYNRYIMEAIEIVMQDNLIDIAKLLHTHSPQSVLFEILSPLGYTPSVIEDIASNLDSIPGKIYLADNYRLLKDRDYLVISENKAEKQEDRYNEFHIYPDSNHLESPIELTFKTEKYTPQFEIVRKKGILQCDIDKLSFPLTLRRWRKGDWFVPFGMKGKKKISDFFTDNKFTMFEKEETWVLLSGDDIVWIVNHRSDNRFRITEATKSVYTISFAKQS